MTELNSRSHNMLIHGVLLAVQNYVVCFGLEGTAAYVLKQCAICKEDIIRCQLETGYENERMLGVIEKAFAL